MNLAIQVNKVKIGVLLAYISSKITNVNLQKLIKLVFLVDELYVKENGYPMTWLDYYVWEKGPVAPEIYDLKNNGGIFSDYVKSRKDNKDGKYYIYPVSSFYLEGGLLEFGDYHLEIIDTVIKKYGHLNAEKLSDLTHEENSIWSSAVKKNNINFNENSKTDIKLDFTSLIDDKESEKYYAYLEAFENIQFSAALNSK